MNDLPLLTALSDQCESGKIKTAHKNAVRKRDGFLGEMEVLVPRLINDISYLEKWDYSAVMLFFSLLAEFQAVHFYPHVVELFTRHGTEIDEYDDFFLTEVLCRLMATLSPRDFTSEVQVAVNSEANTWVRTACMEALVVRYNEGIISRPEIVDGFRQMFKRIEPDLEQPIDFLIYYVSLIYPEELWPEIEEAFMKQIVSSDGVNPGFPKEMLELGQEDCLKKLKGREKFRFIRDVMPDLKGILW
jgi:hypothetical protein